MPRAVEEWIGRADDSAIPPRVKARIVAAQAGICACGCGNKLGVAGERIEFDHAVALINGGDNRESNLRALRAPCHKAKTAADVHLKSIVARKRGKHLGLTASKAPLPFGRASPWKRRLDGAVVRRDVHPDEQTQNQRSDHD